MNTLSHTATAPLLDLAGADRRRRPGPMLLVACALCIPLAAGVALAFLQASADHRAEQAERLRDAARSVAVAIDARIGAYVGSLETLANSPLLDGPLDLPGFERQARIAGAVLGGTVMLRGPPPRAEVLANTAPERDLVTALVDAGRYPEVMRHAMAQVYDAQRPALSDLFTTPMRAHPLMVIAVPVVRDGQPVLRLSLSKQPIDFQAILGLVGMPAGAMVEIRDGAFALVAGSKAQPGTAAAVAAPWLRDGMAGQRRAVLTGPGSDGRTMLVAAERLAFEPRWMVTVGAPIRDLDVAALDTLAWPVAGVGLVILGIGAVLWAARHERNRVAQRDAAARAEIDRLHTRLPAVIFVREVAPDGTFGRLLYRTGDVLGVTGWAPEVLGETFLGRYAEDPEDVGRAQARFVREGEVTHEWRMRQPKGGFRWIRTKVTALESLPNGNRLTLGYLQDVTAEREARAQAESASRLASMAEMAHGLAHELKQPLQVIALQAESARLRIEGLATGDTRAMPARETVQQVAGALDGIVQQAVRTGDLLDHLRRFARGTAGQDPPEAVDLATVLDNALLLTRHALNRTGVVLDIALAEQAPRVLGQPIALEQILVNLLNNARDALEGVPPGQPRRIRIAAEPEADGAWVALTVADTGGGVPAHVIDRIFEPFVTTKPIETGTGLGLAICHGLARGMGGTISVRNSLEGAVFTLRLPAATSAAGAEPVLLQSA